MNCLKCNAEYTRVRYTYKLNNGTIQRRRRECHSCKFRWTTYEITLEKLEELLNDSEELEKLKNESN